MPGAILPHLVQAAPNAAARNTTKRSVAERVIGQWAKVAAANEKPALTSDCCAFLLPNRL